MNNRRVNTAPSTETDIGLSLSPRCVFYAGERPGIDSRNRPPTTWVRGSKFATAERNSPAPFDRTRGGIEAANIGVILLKASLLIMSRTHVSKARVRSPFNRNAAGNVAAGSRNPRIGLRAYPAAPFTQNAGVRYYTVESRNSIYTVWVVTGHASTFTFTSRARVPVAITGAHDAQAKKAERGPRNPPESRLTSVSDRRRIRPGAAIFFGGVQ